MTTAARRVLADALDQNPALPRDGWDHFLTSMGDDRRSVFAYDREDGTMLRVTLDAGVVVEVIV